MAKKTHPLRPQKIIQNFIDADSRPTHVSESIASDVCVRVSLLPCGDAAAMYYGFYLLAIALLIMAGQLAFALYQMASYLNL